MSHDEALGALVDLTCTYLFATSGMGWATAGWCLFRLWKNRKKG